jgi:hypothetical protein
LKNFSIPEFPRHRSLLVLLLNYTIYNDELDKLIKHQNIINNIKALRLRWFGHVQRMPDFRTVKKIFNWTPLTTRTKGRPKQRWEDNIIQDIRHLNIKNWTACVQDRVKWKNVVEKAKTSNKGS